MTTGTRCAIAAGLALSGACATTADYRDGASSRVQTAVEGRLQLSVPIPTRAFDDGCISTEAAELLAGELTEDTAVKVALLENRAVRASFEELGIAAADLVQAGLLSNPIFAANAKEFDAGTEIELSLAQPFLDLLFRPLRKRVAAADLAAAEARVMRTVVALVFDVRRGFVEARAARARVTLRKEILDAEVASLELMQELHQAGNVTDPQLTATEAAASRAKLDLAEAEADALAAREPLNALMGLWGNPADWTLDDSLAEEAALDDLDHVERRAIGASLDLAESAAGLERHARRLGLTHWEGILSGGELGVALKREAGSGDWGFGPAGALALPIFDAGTAARAAVDAELRQALARHVELAVEIRSAARTLRDRNRVLQDRARYLREVDIRLRSRLVIETLRNFNAMQIGIFDVIVAKQQHIEARREHLDVLRDAALARLDIEELFAGVLDRDRFRYHPMPAKSRGSMTQREEH